MTRSPKVCLDDILKHLHPDARSAVQQKIMEHRESFSCPSTVPDEAGFMKVLWHWKKHLHKCETGVTLPDDTRLQYDTYVEFSALYQRAMRGADLRFDAKNAVFGRAGGMIMMLDKIVDQLIQERVKSYMDGVCFAHVPQNYEDRLRLAEELVERRSAAYPGDQMQPAAMSVPDLEVAIQEYVFEMDPGHMKNRR